MGICWRSYGAARTTRDSDVGAMGERVHDDNNEGALEGLGMDKMTPDTTERELDTAVAEIERFKASAVESEFQCDGHWAMGWNGTSGYWWSYHCCEACDQWDYEQVGSSVELLDRFKDNNGRWFQTQPKLFSQLEGVG